MDHRHHHHHSTATTTTISVVVVVVVVPKISQLNATFLLLQRCTRNTKKEGYTAYTARRYRERQGCAPMKDMSTTSCPPRSALRPPLRAGARTIMPCAWESARSHCTPTMDGSAKNKSSLANSIIAHLIYFSNCVLLFYFLLLKKSFFLSRYST